MKLLFGCLGLVGAALSAAAHPLVSYHSGPTGNLRLELEDTGSFEVRAAPPVPDVLFPEGQMLARLSNQKGDTITISFDDSRSLNPAEREAFVAVTRDEAQAGSANHAVWQEGSRDWILQVFVSPADYVLTAQTFVEGHPLAVTFWLPRPGTPPFEHPVVRRVLTDLTIGWERH